MTLNCEMFILGAVATVVVNNNFFLLQMKMSQVYYELFSSWAPFIFMGKASLRNLQKWCHYYFLTCF